MCKTKLILLSSLLAFNIALTNEAFADDNGDTGTKIALSVPATAAVAAGGIALNLGASLTLTKEGRVLDFGLGGGKGVDGPTLAANLHAGVHTPGSRLYYLAGYRLARYSDTSESFDPSTTDHLVTGRLGIFLPKSGQFRVRLEGELGVPFISAESESGETEITYFNVDSFYAGVSVALSYSFR